MSGQFCVDANIFISTWDVHYPPRISVFTPLWDKLALCRDEIVLIKPVFDEIDPISMAEYSKLLKEEKQNKYPHRKWILENEFDIVNIDDTTRNLSLELEREYEISDVAKGANQTDITLIAHAKIMGQTVVTLEAVQPQKPSEKCNYKIPLICKEQGVNCINFIEMLDRLNVQL